MKKGSRSVRGGGCALFKPQFRRSRTRPDKRQAANRKLPGYLSVLGVQLTLIEPAGAAGGGREVGNARRTGLAEGQDQGKLVEGQDGLDC